MESTQAEGYFLRVLLDLVFGACEKVITYLKLCIVPYDLHQTSHNLSFVWWEW